jgi:translation initiation factor IF-3
MTPDISENDLKRKCAQIKVWKEKKMPVKIDIRVKGRHNIYADAKISMLRERLATLLNTRIGMAQKGKRGYTISV